MLGVKFRDFFLTTFIGIIPGSVVYVWVGTSFAYVIQQGDDIKLGISIRATIYCTNSCFGNITSVVPIFIKKIN